MAGGTVNFSTTGTITTTNTAGDGTGILGDWATIGGSSYIASGGGAMTAYTGTTATASTINSAAANYVVPSGSSFGTLAASSTGNTLQFAGTLASSLTPNATGGLTLNGILSADSGLATIASGGGSLVIGSNKELVITGNAPLTINSVIAPNSGGTSSVTYGGTGTLTLGGLNTFTGAMTINSGTVLVNNIQSSSTAPAQAIGEGNSVVLNGGTLEVGTGAAGAGANANGAIFSPAISVGPAGGTLWNNQGSSGTIYVSYGGALSGSGTLTVLSTASSSTFNDGQVFFEGASSGFTGNLIIGTASANSGQVQYRSSAASPFGTTGTITINAGGLLGTDTGAGSPASLTNSIILNGGLVSSNNSGFTYSGSITLNSGTNSTMASNINGASGTTTYSGPIGGTGSVTISLTAHTGSTDTVVFTGADTYTGSTTVAADILQIGNGTTVCALATSGITLATGTALVFDIPASTTQTYSGPISSSGGTPTVKQSGTGTEILSGTNNYSGTTTVSAGTLEFANEGSLYNNTHGSWIATNIIVQSGGTLAFQVGASSPQFTASDLATLLALGNTATNGFESGSAAGLDTTAGSFEYDGVIANTNAGANVLGLTKLGANTLTLGGANTYGGPTTVSTGTLRTTSAGRWARERSPSPPARRPRCKTPRKASPA